MTCASASDYRCSHLARDKAAAYDASFAGDAFRRFMWAQERRVLDAVVAGFAGRAMSYLDFACGSGRILGHVAPHAASAVGIDVSAAMLELARPKAPRAELIAGDLTRGDLLAGRKFDLITAFRFFPNAQAELRAAAIMALADRLADGGLLVFNNHRNHSGSLFRAARLIGKRPRTMSRREVDDLLAAAGLETVRQVHVAVLPATDGAMLAPAWMHRACDALARKCGLGSLAQNVIYICRHKAGGAR